MLVLRFISSSLLEQIPVLSSTWVSMAVMPLLDLRRKTPGSLSCGENPRLLSFSSKSSCQIRAASGNLYNTLFSLCHDLFPTDFPDLFSHMDRSRPYPTRPMGLHPKALSNLQSVWPPITPGM